MTIDLLADDTAIAVPHGAGTRTTRVSQALQHSARASAGRSPAWVSSAGRADRRPGAALRERHGSARADRGATGDRQGRAGSHGRGAPEPCGSGARRHRARSGSSRPSARRPGPWASGRGGERGSPSTSSPCSAPGSPKPRSWRPARTFRRPMPAPTTAPEPGSGGIRTDEPLSLIGSRCPVCQERPIRGRQTVCSGSCRAKRWRARKVEHLRASASRDEEIRVLLETALKKLRESGHESSSVP